MASTYSPLKIELIGTGEQAGIWGTTTNINLGTALEEAITGSADVSFSGADVTLTLTDTNASQAGRNLRLNLTGASGGARNLILGSGMQIEKLYLINNGLADAVTVKNTTGTGVAVPAGRSMFVFNNGTNVVDAITYLNLTSPSLTTPRVITSINDTNGNELFGVTATTSAVNEFTVANAATGNAPTLSATGGDTNIGMALTPKGTGGVIFPAGAVGTPSITTTGDLNTGIFFPAADTIAFTEGGVEAMRIDSSGRVGIGTTSPSDILEIAGSTSPTVGFIGLDTTSVSNAMRIIFRESGTTKAQVSWSVDNSALEFLNQDEGGYTVFFTTPTGGSITERMRIDSSGNVGIGTTSPSSFVHINTSSAEVLRLQSSNGSPYLPLYNSSAGRAGYIQWATTSFNIISELANVPMIFGTVNTERMRIDSSGNVGIGITDARNSRLHLNNAGSAGAPQLMLTSSSDSSQKQAEIRFESTALIFNFWNNPGRSEAMRITTGGDFLIGNTSAAGKLFAATTGATQDNFFTWADNASYTAASAVLTSSRSANSAYNFLLGISGRPSPTSGSGQDVEFKLQGDGNAFADGTWSNNGADYAEFFESANGEALTLGATVVLDGNKVREATEQDPDSAIIGVVRPKEPSKASMIIGNTAWNKWANKYLSDDFDRYIMEDHDVVEWEEQVLEKEAVEAVEAVVDEEGNEVSPAIPAQEATYRTISHSYESHRIPEGITVPADATIKTHDDKGNKFQHYKLNPAWDKDAEYVNRENRPEWNIIGLVGQVKVLKSQPTNDRWIKMRDVSATVEEWFIR